MNDFSDILADAAALDRELASRLATAARDAAEKGRAKALDVRRWKDRTGETRDSIKATSEANDKGGEGTLTADSVNAIRLIEGTVAHEIRPKASDNFRGPVRKSQSRREATDIGTHRTALRWEAGGAVHFARVVHHPGTKPDSYMEKAGDEMEKQLDDAVDAILGDLLG